MGKHFALTLGLVAAAQTMMSSTPARANSIDKAVIKRVIFKHRSEFTTCYETALKAQPDLAGKIIAKFDVNADGIVIAVNATGLTTELNDCVAATIKQLRFPKAQGTITINYPFVFAPKGVKTQPS
ncbi:MAG TPA: AgmX/PglI C-terminal domain-containing protein [Kofleriaceae bacterium]|nr:AgmX/PglI C-terminal domain-containing protein [Kofleriaceae bacterium]